MGDHLERVHASVLGLVVTGSDRHIHAFYGKASDGRSFSTTPSTETHENTNGDQLPEFRAVQTNRYYVGKRAVDLLFSVFLLVILSPILLVIAIAIVIEEPGSPLYAQNRIGTRRRRSRRQHLWELVEFRFYKFRTMVRSSDPAVHQSHIRDVVNRFREPRSSLEPMNKIPGDTRVTRVGRVLRRSSLDELPQLWNILRG